jgi:hypothetical protein
MSLRRDAKRKVEPKPRPKGPDVRYIIMDSRQAANVKAGYKFEVIDREWGGGGYLPVTLGAYYRLAEAVEVVRDLKDRSRKGG